MGKFVFSHFFLYICHMSRNILITGGAGFIGSHVLKYFVEKYPEYKFIMIDKLTYACSYSTDNIPEYILDQVDFFPKMDIIDAINIEYVIKELGVTDIIHLAAESHVDNSINNPNIFAQTNVLGTLNLLNVAKNVWGENSPNRFYHISTDEVYGDLNLSDAPFEETTPYDPSSPYSASKAASDHFVRAYARTYGMNCVISNCSNNYGPHQHNEKLIPTVIRKLVNGEKIPVYGTGENVRDWLWVGDHVKAIDEIFHNGKKGHTYNVGGDNELTNLEIVRKITELYQKHVDYSTASCGVYGTDPSWRYVEDRKGHDLRYAINSNKLQTNLNWKPEKDFEEGILETIKYYVERYG
jgi:dTDP-glucose 4,6-dehydratase